MRAFFGDNGLLGGRPLGDNLVAPRPVAAAPGRRPARRERKKRKAKAARPKRRYIKHDRLFKELLRTFFMEFLELFFPEVAAYVEPSSIEFLDKEIFTDVTRGERHEADLIVKVAFRGSPATFLIHIEAQGKQQDYFPERMFTYFARFHERHRLPVYPIAVFHYRYPLSAAPTEYAVNFPDLEALKFQFRTVQLNRLSWRDFLSRSNPVASALMARMHIQPGDRPKVKAECLRLMSTLHLDPAKQQLITGFVDQALGLSKQELVVFKKEIAKFRPEETEAVLKITTSWEKEGIKQGIKEGLAVGEARGLLLGIEPSLQLRFGSEGLAFLERLRHGVDVARLKRIAKQVVTATSLDELEKTAFAQVTQPTRRKR